MSTPDFLYRSATDLAYLIRSGELSAVEITKASLERAAAIQPGLNAFCVLCPEQALEKAAAIDAARARGDTLPLLAGVPVAIKDFTPTRGIRTTFGSRVFADHMPDRDAVIVERLAAAGTILIGKTTTPEFADSFFTRSSLWGTTRNPWNPDRNPGGSSGGSAVAVATGAVAMAEGCDMGGSVRGPAADCGIVGLKPSFGRIPFDILDTCYDDISHFGPLTRTIDDAVAFLAATAGAHPADPQSYVPALQLDGIAAGVDGLRVAVTTDFGFYRVDEDVAANVLACAQALAGAGAQVESAAPAWDQGMVEAWFDLSTVWLAGLYGHHLDQTPELLDPLAVKIIEMGRKMDAVTHKRIELTRSRQWRELARLFETFDVLLCPTMALPPLPLDTDDFDYFGNDEQGRFLGADFTALINSVPHCPALSVPAGMTRDGLPTGLQIIGKPYDEASVLRVGMALEKLRPWAGRRPPL